MKKLYLLPCVILLTFLSACTSAPTKDIQVDRATDAKVNLSAYKTYAWLGSAAVLNDPEGQWQPAEFDISSHIKFLINRELLNRDLTQVQGSEADIVMSFFMGVDMDAKKLKADPKSDVEIPVNVPKAALIVVALDSDTGYVIWIGTATGDVIKDATMEITKARLDYAIKKMFNPRFYDSWF